MSPRRGVAAVGASAVCALALSACHQPVYLNPKGEEQALMRVIDATPKYRGKIKSISCPSNYPPDKGKPYTCSAVATDGTKGHVVGVQSDNKGNLDDVQFVK
ncbi:MAG TPA: hypothetical protein VHX88_12180 [Solirubrobacteraceae bacterium]|nr:hypothetical protein [Solirubrobacteraceae bacterium]